MRMKKLRFITTILLSLTLQVQAQEEEKKEYLTKKSMSANSVESTPKIDGYFDDDFWKEQTFESYQFVRFLPNNGTLSNQQTAVKIAYNDFGIYIAAKLYDDSKEGVKKELGIRDDDSRNTDQFGILFDTYQKGQNAFYFKVSAAGVQTDILTSRNSQDYNWDAVWRSAVQITTEGWQVEIEIPYAAIRFAQADEQEWNINIMRKIQRLNETAYWSYVDNSIDGLINQSGTLTGLYNLKPPLRLSLSPYITGYINKAGDESNLTGTIGADLKYGINESFTLDMTLIPDFGQVVSDNLIYNLGPFEVYYSENRPFFTEGIELFNRGNVFYSRRVGQSFGELNIEDQDTVVSAPNSAPLINATKLTGRTKNGTGLGLFNAVTNRTFAEVRDTVTGEIRKVQVDDLTNFNAVVIDQNLKNNSSVSLINTNVQRLDGGRDANVIAGDFNLRDKTNTYQLSGGGAYNYISSDTGKISDGHTYNASLAKISGNYQFDIGFNVENDTYNPNDFGFLSSPNEVFYYAWGGYRQFQPTGIFNEYSYWLGVDYSQLYAPRSYQRLGTSTEFWGQLKNFHEVYVNFNYRPLRSFDYFEPRVDGKKYFRTWNYNTNFNYSTDGRKRLQLNFNFGVWQAPDRNQFDYWYGLSPRFRVNNKLSTSYSVSYNKQNSSIGYAIASNDELGSDDMIYFGERDISVLSNLWQVNYTINNKMGFNFRLRHYWSKVDYFNYFQLMNDGDIRDIAYNGRPTAEHEQEIDDTNYNAFSIDAVYSWQIAPGSFVNIVYKDNLQESNELVNLNYGENLNSIFSTTHYQSLSCRLIFYLDYATIARNLRNKKG
ncbi:hypothetical protein GCM10027429_04510 [Marivirga atlantica]|jgi:hypothetical protein